MQMPFKMQQNIFTTAICQKTIYRIRRVVKRYLHRIVDYIRGIWTKAQRRPPSKRCMQSYLADKPRRIRADTQIHSYRYIYVPWNCCKIPSYFDKIIKRLAPRVREMPVELFGMPALSPPADTFHFDWVAKRVQDWVRSPNGNYNGPTRPTINVK